MMLPIGRRRAWNEAWNEKIAVLVPIVADRARAGPSRRAVALTAARVEMVGRAQQVVRFVKGVTATTARV
ncbi:hypothetical protein [Streptomyces sp. NPDC059129]|uniref:hypothetical protein n=1 Tax=unclassified Streptomyces TaxID=2593676 RepID=UPI0036C57E4B